MQEGKYKEALGYYNKALPFIIKNYKTDNFYYKTINKNLETCQMLLMTEGEKS